MKQGKVGRNSCCGKVGRPYSRYDKILSTENIARAIKASTQKMRRRGRDMGTEQKDRKSE